MATDIASAQHVLVVQRNDTLRSVTITLDWQTRDLLIQLIDPDVLEFLGEEGKVVLYGADRIRIDDLLSAIQRA